MPVFYRLHQDQSVGTKRSGKWYARMVPTSTINTKQLAAIMQRNCTVKVSDIRAVIDQLQGCTLGQGLHRHRQHQGCSHRIHA